MRSAALLAGLLLSGVMSNTGAQVVYKWVDDEAVTHFSAQPPVDVNAERTTVTLHRTSRTTPQPDGNADNEADTRKAAAATGKQDEQEVEAGNRVQAEKDRKLRAENCEKAQQRLETYTNARRLYRPLENGEREYLSDDELDAQRAEARQLVSDWCG